MFWLEKFFTFLKVNNGIITAFATVFLTGITWWYVYLTRLMLKAANTPVVRMFLHASEDSITLCVQNIGTGFARDIKFKGDLSFKPRRPENVKLKDLKPFKDGIPYLGSGDKSETFLCHRHALGDLPAHRFDITVFYKDLANFKDDDTFTFEIGNWDNTDQFGSPHTDDSTSAIERVAAALNRMSMNNLGDSGGDWGSQLQIRDIADTLKRIADALEGKTPSDE